MYSQRFNYGAFRRLVLFGGFKISQDTEDIVAFIFVVFVAARYDYLNHMYIVCTYVHTYVHTFKKIVF
jgi:hypothetical protein